MFIHNSRYLYNNLKRITFINVNKLNNEYVDSCILIVSLNLILVSLYAWKLFKFEFDGILLTATTMYSLRM